MLCRLVKQKKVRRGLQRGLIFLGVVMLGICLVLARLGRLEGSAEGFYLGAGTGLTMGGLALCGVMLAAWPLSRPVFWLAFALVLLYALSYLLAFAYFWKKL